jgi:DNA-directed RNA polymerase III subunit RPC11
MRRVCPTCPYKWVIAQRISMRTHLKRKEVDDVLGGKDSWANVDVVDGESIGLQCR